MNVKRTRTRVAATKSRQSPSNEKRSHQRKKQWADSGTLAIAHRIPKRLTATAAIYDKRLKIIIVRLRCGLDLSFLPSAIRALEERTARDLGVLKISRNGGRLYWPRLNVHVGIRSLLLGTFGSKKPIAKERTDHFAKES